MGRSKPSSGAYERALQAQEERARKAEQEAAALKAQEADYRKRQQEGAGRSILTSGSGDTTTPSTKKTILGAGA